MEPSIKYFIGTGAAVVVVVLCLCWPVYYSVAQDNDAAPDSSLTIGKCIDASDGEAAATATDRHFLANEPLAPNRTLVAVVQSTSETQYNGNDYNNGNGTRNGDGGEDPGTGGEVPGVGPVEETLIKEDIIEEDLLQTKVTNGMCEDMLEQTSDSTPVRSLVVAQNYMQEIKFIEEAMGRAGGDLEDRIGVTPIRKQAAAAANVGEDSDASIAERLNQKEAAAREAGASAPEAAAGARCGLEVDVLDEEVRRTLESGMYEIKPQIPEEMRHRETKQAGLLVSPLTKEGFQKIRQTHRVIAKTSESNIGCVDLTDQMSAKLIELAEELHIEPRHTDDIRELSPNRDTRWSWDITTSQTGEHKLLLELGYTTLREGSSEVRWIKESVYEGAIKVTRPAPPEQPWWRRIFERIFEFFRT